MLEFQLIPLDRITIKGPCCNPNKLVLCKVNVIISFTMETQMHTAGAIWHVALYCAALWCLLRAPLMRW